jgi:hypothetical protein
MLDKDLMQAFTGLDIHVVFFLDRRPLALHQTVIDDTTAIIDKIPFRIKDLVAARYFWQLIMRRNYHFKTKAQIIGKAAELASPKKGTSWQETADFDGGEFPFSKIKESSIEIQAECQHYISDIYHCSEATSVLFDSLDPSDKTSILIATILKIHVKMNIITLAGLSFTSETAFDTLLPEFSAITDFSSSIHSQLISTSSSYFPILHIPNPFSGTHFVETNHHGTSPSPKSPARNIQALGKSAHCSLSNYWPDIDPS